jgi:hypothetical protein
MGKAEDIEGDRRATEVLFKTAVTIIDAPDEPDRVVVRAATWLRTGEDTELLPYRKPGPVSLPVVGKKQDRVRFEKSDPGPLR